MSRIMTSVHPFLGDFKFCTHEWKHRRHYSTHPCFSDDLLLFSLRRGGKTKAGLATGGWQKVAEFPLEMGASSALARRFQKKQ